MVIDIFIYSAIFIFIAIIWCISTSGMKKSLEYSKHAEKNLMDERNVLEQRISERTKELLATEESRRLETERVILFGRLSQGLFHDLMNPLSTLSLFVENMNINENNSAETKKIIQGMIHTSRRMNSFMASVKRCLETDRYSVDNEKADIRAEIMIAVDVLAYKARMAEVEIRVKTFESITLPIHPVRLHQVFLNLISNAIDACTQGQASRLSINQSSEVEISVTKHHSNVHITVTDNGCGINKKFKENLFKEQVTDKKTGSGMGLMTVRKIIEDELKGTITVASSEGGGKTIFHIVVPLVLSTI